MPSLEAVSPLLPALILLLGVALQLVYGGALAWTRGRVLRRVWPRVFAFMGGGLGLAGGWMLSDAVFLVGQTVLCLAYLARPDLGMGAVRPSETSGDARG